MDWAATTLPGGCFCCLFVCLFVCLYFCLFVCLFPTTDAYLFIFYREGTNARGSDAAKNKWMLETARLALSQLKPKVDQMIHLQRNWKSLNLEPALIKQWRINWKRIEMVDNTFKGVPGGERSRAGNWVWKSCLGEAETGFFFLSWDRCNFWPFFTRHFFALFSGWDGWIF